MSRRCATLVVFANVVIIALANTSISEPVSSVQNHPLKDSVVNYRLPNTSHPVNYGLSIVTRVDKDAFEFSGNVKIGIVVDRETREIVLHARELTIVNITLGRYRGRVLFDLKLEPFEHDVVTELLSIRTSRAMLFGGDRLQLQINYVGTLRTDRGGFYRSSYVNGDGVTK